MIFSQRSFCVLGGAIFVTILEPLESLLSRFDKSLFNRNIQLNRLGFITSEQMLRGKCTQIIVLLFAYAAFSYATTCDPNNGLNEFNPVCTDESEPYCVMTVVIINNRSYSLKFLEGGANPTYECRECASVCDCGLNEYCDKAPGNTQHPHDSQCK